MRTTSPLVDDTHPDTLGNNAPRCMLHETRAKEMRQEEGARASWSGSPRQHVRPTIDRRTPRFPHHSLFLPSYSDLIPIFFTLSHFLFSFRPFSLLLYHTVIYVHIYDPLLRQYPLAILLLSVASSGASTRVDKLGNSGVANGGIINLRRKIPAHDSKYTNIYTYIYLRLELMHTYAHLYLYKYNEYIGT